MPTKEKLEAFEKYDFGGDERWINYFNNLTIPPNRTDGLAIVRRYKQKFYKKYVDPDFEVETLGEAASSSSGTSASAANRAAEGSSSTRTSGPSGSSRIPPGRADSSGSSYRAGARPGSSVDWVTLQFLGNAWVILMAAVSMFPIAPLSVTSRCFRLCLAGSLVTSLLSVFLKHGTPRGFSWQSIKVWLQSCVSGPELPTILHCSAFLPSLKPVVLATVPLACHLTPAVAEYLQQNFNRAEIYRKYLERPCTWLTSNATQVNLFAANMEISLGFLVIFFLLTPQRNIMLVFFYWQILRLQYQLPTSSWYHRQIWSQLGARVEPFLQQYAPFLLTPLSYGKRWFTNVG